VDTRCRWSPRRGRDYVRVFWLELTGKLSPAALETLAVVAYRSRNSADVEAVRASIPTASCYPDQPGP